MTTSLITDIRLYLANDNTRRNIANARSVFGPNRLIQETVPLAASQSGWTSLNVVSGNKATILINDGVLPIALEITTATGSLTVDFVGLFVFSAAVTGLRVKNVNTTAQSPTFVQV